MTANLQSGNNMELSQQTGEIFFQNLRGHDYIKARGLSPKLVAAHQHTCESCRQAEELPRVQRLVENWKGEEA